MKTTDAQVRKLMEEMTKHGGIGLAAMQAGVGRKTARKYVKGGKLPSELVEPRSWRTHEDAFLEHWPELEAMLGEAPALEAKTLFEVLVDKYPGRYEEGQLRTLQRRVKAWRAERGPDKDVVLAQHHRPGEAAQTDFTWTTELAVTIASQAFVHMLCVFVLPYSNWRWATVCLSEPHGSPLRGGAGAEDDGSMTSGRPVDLDALHVARANLRHLAGEHPELTTEPSKANRRAWETEVEAMMGDETKDEQIVVRLPGSLLERVDAYAERLRREMPGPSWRRSDVVRMLLAKALDETDPPKRGRR